jgi:Flp pilus assembly protein CpaB
VSRRARAIAFAAAALGCAALAAAIAGGYRSGVADQFGPLRPVVVARAELPADRQLDPGAAARLLTVRRVPASFVPPGALAAPEQAVGRAPASLIPAGAYLLAAQLDLPHHGARHRSRTPNLGAGREPVEIAVTGAEPLAATGRDPRGQRVDVVVTSEPGPGATGRTYLAAEGVKLLGLAEANDSGSNGFPAASVGAWTATLALTRPQALHLIEAENFAREVRLIHHAE